MIIPITLATSSSSNPKLPSGLVKVSHDEVVLVELQGALDVEGGHPSQRNGKLVGKLTIDEAASRPTLLIGHHLLEGKVAALPKPLAVLLRNPSSSSSSSSTSTSGSKTRTNQMEDSLEGDLQEHPREGEEDSGSDDDAMDVDSTGIAVPSRGKAKKPKERLGGVQQDLESQPDHLSLEPSAGWTITAIVKRKIIFSKRPMPVTNKK